MTDMGTPTWRAVDRVLAEILRRVAEVEGRLSQVEARLSTPRSEPEDLEGPERSAEPGGSLRE